MELDPLERLLHDHPTDADDSFADARGRFTARAMSEGRAAVAYEDHDTPLGTLRLGATEGGIVRVALPTEDHDGMLDELARAFSPRILHAASPQLTAARRELDEYFVGRRPAFEVNLDWSLTQRVLRSDGALGQYRGGSAAKGQLLELEHAR